MATKSGISPSESPHHLWEKKPLREVPQILEEMIGSRAAPSESKRSLTLQPRRVIAIEVAVVIVFCEGTYLALPGDLLFPGFRGSQSSCDV